MDLVNWKILDTEILNQNILHLFEQEKSKFLV